MPAAVLADKDARSSRALPMTPPERPEVAAQRRFESAAEAVRAATIFTLQMPDAEIRRRLRPLFGVAFVRALEQDGFTVVPKAAAAEPLRSALERLRPFLSHGWHYGPDGAWKCAGSGRCTCGLDDNIAALEATAPSTPEPSYQARPGWRSNAEITVAEINASTPEPALDVERVKRAVVNVAKRHGLAKDPPIPLSVARIYGYSAAPAEMDAEIAREYAALTSESRAAAPQEGDEG